MAEEDEFTEHQQYLLSAGFTREELHQVLESIDGDVHSKGDRVGDDLEPATLTPQYPAGATGIGANRQLQSTGTRSIQVPQDVPFVNTILGNVPILDNHNLDILIDPSYAELEDLCFPAHMRGDTNGSQPTSSSNSQISIKSQTNEKYHLNSAYAGGVHGTQISIRDAVFHGPTPFVGRDASVVSVSSRIRLYDCEFSIDDPPIEYAFEPGASSEIKVQEGLDVGTGQIETLVLPKFPSAFSAHAPPTGSVDHILATGPDWAAINIDDPTQLDVQVHPFKGPPLRGITYRAAGVDSLLDFDIDTDDTTELELNLDAYGTEDVQLVVVSGKSGGGGELRAQFNGVSSGDYSYTQHNGGDLVTFSGQTYLMLIEDVTNRMTKLRADILASPANAGQISIGTKNSQGYRPDRSRIASGLLDMNDEAPLESVRLSGLNGEPRTGYAYLRDTRNNLFDSSAL